LAGPSAFFSIGTPRASSRVQISILPVATAMSQRSHFWLRTVALAFILFAEFGPRIWQAPSASATPVVVATDAR
jgi:hypothetical protein